MFFKLTHCKETHIYNPKDNPSLLGLKAYVKNAFKSLPDAFQFSYLDEENDQITLSNEEDFKIMRQTSNKVVKILIKKTQYEFFDQTAKVELDDEIEKLAQEISSNEVQQKEKFVNIVEEPKAIEQKEEKAIEQKEISNEIKVTETQIQNKLKLMMPQLIEKLKQEIVKESSIRGSVNSEIKIEVPVEKERIIHKVTCAECGNRDFEGVCYKCPICVEFNICQKCETTSEHPHPFLKIKHPKQAEIKISGQCIKCHQNPFNRIPFVKDIKNIAEGFLGIGRRPEIKEGFNPYFCGVNKFFDVNKKINFPKLNKNEQKPEQKNEEIHNAEKQTLSKLMKTASYLADILNIDFNRCYKFAEKNPSLSQQQLLQLYFEDTKQLV